MVRPNEFDGNIIIEAWKYPSVTKIGTRTEWVDRLSLAVSLRDNYDARVQGELTRLIEQSLQNYNISVFSEVFGKNIWVFSEIMLQTIIHNLE